MAQDPEGPAEESGPAERSGPGVAGGPGEAGGPAEPAVRRRLVAAATRLFAEKGYENASVQEIVAAAGVTKGSMYHYFQAKDDLLFEIYHDVLAMQMDRLERLASGTGTSVDRLRAVAVDVVATSIEHLDAVTVFFRSMHSLPPERLESVRRERRIYHDRFKSIVAEGQAAGLLRTDVEADLAVHYFFGSVHHLQTWYRPDGPLNGAQVGNAFAQLLVDGLSVAA
jgi:AcrR family transcriptional regulator